MKRILIIAAAVLALGGCGHKQQSGGQVPSTFLGGAMSFGDSPEQVLKGLYAQGFTDAATGEQDSHFDTIPPAAAGQPTLLKMVVPADTAGFASLGQRWTDVQVQLDGHGLYCVTYHSSYAAPQATAERYAALLHALEERQCHMTRTVVGTSAQEGETTDITGHRYTAGGALVQTHLNTDAATGTQSISLIFTQTDPQ